MQALVSIVTGGGSGIGRELALLLHEAGHAVVIAGRRPERLLETIAQGSGSPDRWLAHPADLRNDLAAATLVDSTIARFGRIDTLVNCAGVAPLRPLHATDEPLLIDTFEVNAFGPAALIRRCWPHFLQQGSGCIVSVSTLGTTDPFAGYFAYAAAKSALDSMTRSAAREGRDHGIRVFGVNLGCVETDMLRGNFSKALIPGERAHSPRVAAAFLKTFIDGQRDSDQGMCVPLPGP